MNVSDEYKEVLNTLRTEYATVVQMWKYLAGARALLLITASTVIGTVMNLYRTGLASFKTAHIQGTGQIISVVSDVPTVTATTLASTLVGAVVIAVLVLDIVAGRIQKESAERGFEIERQLGTVHGVFQVVVEHDHEVSIAFHIARGILCMVAFSWAVVFFSLSA